MLDPCKVRSVLLHHLSTLPYIWRGHVLPKEDLKHVDVQLKLTVPFSGPLEVSVAFDNEAEEVMNTTAAWRIEMESRYSSEIVFTSILH